MKRAEVKIEVSSEVVAATEENRRTAAALRERLASVRDRKSGGMHAALANGAAAAIHELLALHGDDCNVCQRVRALLPAT